MEQIISADAARAYLHISKRKFLFMLQNGYIRYEDNGNKTHRYSLRMCDVEALRQEMIDHPRTLCRPERAVYGAKEQAADTDRRAVAGGSKETA